MYMPPLTIISFYNNCTFGSFFTCFGFKIWCLKRFLDRSVSFLRKETHEHVKTIKKRCLEANNRIFRKHALKKGLCSLCFPPNSTFRIPNWLFDEISKWFCMVLPGEAEKHVFSTKNLNFDQKSWKYTGNQKDNSTNNEHTGFPRVPCGPVGLWNLRYLYRMYSNLSSNSKHLASSRILR